MEYLSLGLFSKNSSQNRSIRNRFSAMRFDNLYAFGQILVYQMGKPV